MKTFFSNQKLSGRNPNLIKIEIKNGLSFFSEVGGRIFLSPCYQARLLQQIYWFKIFCRMYGLIMMLTIPRSSTVSLINIYHPIHREEETPNRGDIGSSYTTPAPWNDPRRPQRPEVTPRTPLLPQVWILCFKCFLNPIRFYLMRESDSKMTKPKAGQNPLPIHLHLIFERDF